MRKTFLILFLGLSLFVNSQISYVEWDNKTEPISEQKRYYDDGSIKFLNHIINDTLYRTEFFQNDSIKVIAQISQFKPDTIWMIDAITLEDRVEIVDYTNDFSDGVFIEFNEQGTLLRKGIMYDDDEQGKWYYYRGNGTLERIVFYDSKGHKKEVKEFYEDGNIKVFGKYTFKRTEKIEIFIDSITKEEVDVNVIYEDDIKSGIWKYFFPNGKLEKKINYGKVK